MELCVSLQICVLVSVPGLGPAEVVWQASLLCLVSFGSYILQPISCFHSMFSHCLLVWLHSVAGLHKQPLDIATEGREGVGLTFKYV